MAFRFRKGLLIELELWWSFWNDDSRFAMLDFDSINAPYACLWGPHEAACFCFRGGSREGTGEESSWDKGLSLAASPLAVVSFACANIRTRSANPASYVYIG